MSLGCVCKCAWIYQNLGPILGEVVFSLSSFAGWLDQGTSVSLGSGVKLIFFRTW